MDIEDISILKNEEDEIFLFLTAEPAWGRVPEWETVPGAVAEAREVFSGVDHAGNPISLLRFDDGAEIRFLPFGERQETLYAQNFSGCVYKWHPHTIDADDFPRLQELSRKVFAAAGYDSPDEEEVKEFMESICGIMFRFRFRSPGEPYSREWLEEWIVDPESTDGMPEEAA